jgi:pseudouridine synthase
MNLTVEIAQFLSMLLMVLFMITWNREVVDAFHVGTVAVSLVSPSKLPRSSQTKLNERTVSTMVILYHKPKEVVTTHASEDSLGRLNVYQDIINRARYAPTPLPTNFPSGWHSIGRLDAATSGLLLLTNDGGLVHHVTNHRAASATESPLKKTYEVLSMGYHTEDSVMFDKFRQGDIDIGNNQLTLPVHDLHVLDHPTAKTTRLSLTIIEGRNRQIRRMFHSCGSGVMGLTRTAIWSSSSNCLTIDMVPMAGEWCILSDEMISSSLGWKPRIIQEFNASSPKPHKSTGTSPFRRTMNTRTPRQQPKSRR